MTIRAIIIGFIGVILISSLTFFNDAIMHHTYLIGNNMPIAVYGTLILMLLIINPLLKMTKIINIMPGVKGTKNAIQYKSRAIIITFS